MRDEPAADKSWCSLVRR